MYRLVKVAMLRVGRAGPRRNDLSTTPDFQTAFKPGLRMISVSQEGNRADSSEEVGAITHGCKARKLRSCSFQ